MLVTVFSPFLTMFSTHSKKNFSLSVTFILSSANAFNLNQSKNSLFGKDLKKGFGFSVKLRKLSPIICLCHSTTISMGESNTIVSAYLQALTIVLLSPIDMC